MKKLLLMLLGVLMALPVIARDFSYEYEGQTLVYTVLDEEAKTCQTKAGSNWSCGNNVSGSLIIPEIAKDGDVEYIVTSIGKWAFYGSRLLTEVKIPDSVTSIGIRAFDDCRGLTEVIIPNSVTSIDYFAFNNCRGLVKAAYPSTVRNPFENNVIAVQYPAEKVIIIEDGMIYGPEKSAIYYAPLALEGEYTLPESVKTIGEKAFAKCNLSSVKALPTVPATMVKAAFDDATYESALLTIPDGTLADYYGTNWSNFKNIHVDGASENVGRCSDDVFNYIYIPGSNEAILVRGDYSALTNASVPNRIAIENGQDATFYQVTEIGVNAFSDCTKLTSVKLPKNLTKICNGAFKGCTGISQMELPDGVVVIGNSAFQDTKLTSIDFPQGLTSIGNDAFMNCRALKTVDLGNNIAHVGNGAFRECTSLERAVMGDKIDAISDSTFSDCSKLSDVTIGKKVNTIGNSAFLRCGALKNIELPSSLNTIGEYAFSYTGLESIVIPDKVKTIGDAAFQKCGSLKSVEICNGVADIQSNAFYSCYNLGSIVIPASVDSIGESAFKDCRALTSFSLADGTSPLVIAKDAVYGSPIEKMYIGRDVPTNAFQNNGMKELVIGNTVTTIGDKTFKGCSKLTSLTLGSSLQSIGASAFASCPLTDVVIPPTVETIGASAFDSNNIKSLAIGYGIKEIGENAFNANNAIENIYITAVNPPVASNNTFSYYEAPLWLINQTAFDNYINYPRCWYRFEDNMQPLKQINEVSVDKLTLSGAPGEVIKLNATIIPADATLPNLFWKSTRPDLVTVDNEGNVTILSDGEDAPAARSTEECKIIAMTMYENVPVVEVSVNVATDGIEDVVADGNESGNIDFSAPVEVYNLSGLFVADTVDGLTPGIYIVRQGKNVVKHLIK